MPEQEQPYHFIPDLAALLPEIPADSIISRDWKSRPSSSLRPPRPLR